MNQLIVLRRLDNTTVHSFRTSPETMFVLSPLMTISDLKQYIMEELSEMVVINNSDPSHLHIWSAGGNIEYDNSEMIYQYGMDTSLFVKRLVADNINAFIGTMYIVGDFGELKSNELKEQSSYKTIYTLMSNVEVNMQASYSNTFKSPFQLEDYTHLETLIKTLGEDWTITLRLMINDKLLLSGNLLSNVTEPSKDYFTFVITYLQKTAIVITQKKIIAHDISAFETFIQELFRVDPNMSMPERYNNSAMYLYKTNSPISLAMINHPMISLFFINNKGWSINNILMSKNSKLVIFIAKTSIKIKTHSSQQLLATHAFQLLEAINSTLEQVEDTNMFGKIQGVYWSRICQNTESVQRKPIRTAITSSSSTNSSFDETGLSSITLDGYMYECLSEWENKYIGILRKPYELSELCLPCCYRTPQVSKNIFQKCFGSEVIPSVDTFSLFIIDSNRILNKKRLGFLEDQYNEQLNKEASIKLDGKKLVSCKKYYLVSGNHTVSFNDVIDYLKDNPQHVVIQNNNFYTSMYITSEPITYIYSIKSFYYRLVLVTKNASEDMLSIQESYPLHYSIMKHSVPRVSQQYVSNNVIVPVASLLKSGMITRQMLDSYQTDETLIR